MFTTPYTYVQFLGTSSTLIEHRATGTVMGLDGPGWRNLEKSRNFGWMDLDEKTWEIWLNSGLRTNKMLPGCQKNTLTWEQIRS